MVSGIESSRGIAEDYRGNFARGKEMRIWLLSPYHQIPGEGWRDSRFIMLGKALAGRGHKVIWWTANFSHTFKSFRSQSGKEILVVDGFTINLVPTSSYRKNVGIGRIWFELRYALSCFRATDVGAGPDCIVTTDPSQIVGFLGIRLGRKFNAPVVVDVFDMWPELFTLVLPGFLKRFSRVIFLPFHLLKGYNLSRASGIVSLCRTYLTQVMPLASRVRTTPSLAVFNGIDLAEFRKGMPTNEQITGYAKSMGKEEGDVWAIYTGTLGNNYDVRALIEGSAILADRRSNISIIVVGEGPLRHEITSYIGEHANAKIRYLGPSMKPDDLLCLYKTCDIALCAYSKDSNVAMPNKAYDYMAAGMPIVNSLRGELEGFLAENEIGIQYIAGDPASLADALSKMSEDSVGRARMAKNAYDRAYLFDSNVLYQQYSKFIEDVRDGNNPACL
jgi:glycosyltransferase involved in cell wall biosynthesis